MTTTIPRTTPALPAGPFRSRQDIIATRVHDCIVLLNRATEQYLTLHEVAARIWELLHEGLTPTAVVDRLCDEYDASREHVTVDVVGLLEGWLGQGLIEPGTVEQRAELLPVVAVATLATRSLAGADSATAVVVPSALRCWLTLFAVKAMLKILGFARTIDYIRRQVGTIPGNTSVDVVAVRAVEWSVAMAGGLYPGRARCLEQSLVLYCLLRRKGVAVKYCQGVQSHPFEAHAWIEYLGEIINDVEEHVARFVRLPEQLP